MSDKLTVESVRDIYGLSHKPSNPVEEAPQGITESPVAEIPKEEETKTLTEVAPEGIVPEGTPTEESFVIPDEWKNLPPEKLAKIAHDNKASYTQGQMKLAEAERLRQEADARSMKSADILARILESQQKATPPQPEVKDDFQYLSRQEVVAQRGYIEDLRVAGQHAEAANQTKKLEAHLLLQEERLDAKRNSEYQERERAFRDQQHTQQENIFIEEISRKLNLTPEQKSSVILEMAQEFVPSKEAWRQIPGYMETLFFNVASRMDLPFNTPPAPISVGVGVPGSVPQKSPERGNILPHIPTEREKEISEEYGVSMETIERRRVEAQQQRERRIK